MKPEYNILQQDGSTHTEHIILMIRSMNCKFCLEAIREEERVRIETAKAFLESRGYEVTDKHH